MRPPLVRDLMSDDIPDVVHGRGIPEVDDEADALGIGDHGRERLREVIIFWKLDYAKRAVREGSKIGGVVCQRLLHGIEHAGDVCAMFWMMVDGELDTIPGIPRDRIATGDHRPEIQDRRVKAVAKASPAAFEPF